MTSKNNTALLLYYAKLCASFQIHWWIQTWVTVRQRSIRVKISDFLSHMMDVQKKIWQLFYTTLSFVHHFKATGELKFELQSVNAQFGSNQRFFVPCDLVNWWMTLKDNRVSFVHHFKAIGKLKLELQSGNAQFGSKSMIFCSLWPWNVTNDHKKNDRAPVLCCFKLCASFRSKWWIQTGVTARKRPIKRVTLRFDGWTWKIIGHLS